VSWSVTTEQRGTDPSGQVVTNGKHVSSTSDLYVTGRVQEGVSELVELKVNELWPKTKYMHLKKSNLKTYIREKATVVCVDKTGFLVLTPKHLKMLAKKPLIPFKGFGGKLSYQLTADDVVKWGVSYEKWTDEEKDVVDKLHLRRSSGRKKSIFTNSRKCLF